MTTATTQLDLDILVRDSHRADGIRPSAPRAPALPAPAGIPTRAEVRKGLALRLAGVLVWATGVALFAFGVAPHFGELEWRADLAIPAGALLGLIGFCLAEISDRYIPAGSLAESVRHDPDLSQSWAVGIALGGGSGCGGGGDGGGGGGC